MRARAVLAILAVWALLAGTVLGTTPARATVVQNEVERGQFALAGWSSMDGGTGEEHFRMVTVNAPIGGDADVYYDSWDAYPIQCPGGEDGQRIIEGSGQGTGSFVVDRNLAAATLAGEMDVKTTTRDICGEAREVTFSRRHVPVSFDLAGVGPRWRESGGTFQHIPGFVNSHTRAVAIGRDAAGTFTVGDDTFPLVFGDFGRVSGKWHYSQRIGTSAARMAILRSIGGPAQPSRTRTGAIARAGAIWERTRGDRYRGILVEADQTRGEGVVVYLEGYASRPIECSDGSRSLLEEFQYGEADGTLSIRGHDARAAAAATMDVVTDTVNGCTGDTTSTLLSGLSVALALEGTGAFSRSGEWSAIHSPGHGNDGVWVSWAGRDAAGSIRLATVEYQPSSWGTIGTYRWREHFQSRRMD